MESGNRAWPYLKKESNHEYIYKKPIRRYRFIGNYR